MELKDYLSGGRLWRLCLKELRESLRDRRTVMTLILMPVLVYPLLSMALQRLMLSSVGSKGAESAYIIGIEETSKGDLIDELLFQAQSVVNSGSVSPIAPIEFSETKQSSTSNLPTTIDAANLLASGTNESEGKSSAPSASKKENGSPQFRLVGIESNSGDSSLETGAIDVLVRSIDRKRVATWIGESVAFDVKIQFRQGDARSEDAAILLRKMCQLLNDQQYRFLRESVQEQLPPIVTLQSVGTKSQSDPSTSIATVIPLVLILMTITGAVYPAIDLTAGEKERGTMEAMIATPAPRFALLLSKYVAVVTVAILTALANLFAAWITLSFGGLGKAIFGGNGFHWLTILQILPILAIFAGFFSSILLALCSFAKSFKEAQAYLIPIMLLALAPGLVTLMPNVHFNPLLAVVPLLNVLLLSRDIMTGEPPVIPTVIALVTTIGYGISALVIAANLFGASSSSSSNQATWSDLVRRPAKRSQRPDLATFALYLGFLFPVLFIVSSSAGLFAKDISLLMGLNAVALFVLFLIIPTVWLIYQRIDLGRTYLLRRSENDHPWNWRSIVLVSVGVALLSSSLWMFALESYLLFQSWSIASFLPDLEKSKIDWLKIPFAWIVLTQAISPAIAEEFFFRGFALSALRNRLRSYQAVLLSALLFAIFHVVTGNVLSLERFFPTFILGCVLGFVAVRTQSIWPGAVLHMCHNSLVLSFTQFEQEYLSEWFGKGEHIPIAWLCAGGVAVHVGLWAVGYSSRLRSDQR